MPRPHNPDHPRTRDRGGKRALQVYLPQDLHTEIHFTARSEGLSTSDYVASILREKRIPKIEVRSWIRWLHSQYEMQSFINGDCVEAMKTLDDQSVHLIITSPPYNIGKKYGIASDRLALQEYLAFSECWMAEAARILHEDGSLWINVGNMADPDGGTLPIECLLWPIGKDLGLSLVQTIVWNHNRGKPQTTKFTQRSERWMWWTKKTEGFTWNLDAIRVPPKQRDKRNHPLGANPGDVWTFSTPPVNSKTRPDHPCPFPLEMISRIVKVCSNSGDTILDPFGGSGTTALAAQQNGREFISIEIDPGFHHVGVRRFEKATQEPVKGEETERAA